MRGSDLSGAILDGRYKLVERLAEGAMGAVYRGTSLKLDRAIAVKVMHAALPAAMSAKQRFQREAMVMARLEHPHCVSVIDYGVHDGKPYVVMELVRGRSLHDLLVEQQRFEPTRAADIVRQALSGLAHAHDQGIIHRDVKPANIMVTPKAPLGVHVRILDFGLARLREASASLSDGIAVGTPSYMAPEQCRGEPLDGRVDVYACGVVLFEMLTGRKPFVGKDPIDIVRRQLQEATPRLADAAPGESFGAALESVVARALAKAPADRFASALAMADAIEAAVAGRGASEATATIASPGVAEGAAQAIASPGVAGGAAQAIASPGVAGARSSAEGAAQAIASPGVAGARSSAEGAAQAIASPGVAGARSSAEGAAQAIAEAPAPVEVSVSVPITVGSTVQRAQPDTSSMVRRTLPVSRMRWAALAAALAIGAAVYALVTLGAGDHAPAVVAARDAADAVPPPVVDQPPADPTAAAQAAITELVAQGRLAAALDAIAKARGRFPAAAAFPFAAGKIYFARLFWDDGVKAFRDAIHLDPSLRDDPELVRIALRGFITTPDTNAELAAFLAELGPSAQPALDETARTHPNPVIRARAAAQLRRSGAGPAHGESAR